MFDWLVRLKFLLIQSYSIRAKKWAPDSFA